MRDDTKRVLAVHDLSGFGRCALTVIIPVLSVMGVCVVPLPTAHLSTHTGGFSNITFLDLTATMGASLEHYKAIGIKFDAIYTGFLGNADQIDTLANAIDMFGKNCPVLVDPVMGDDGVIYATYTTELCQNMRVLCSKADIITPNLTEAYLLCGDTYQNPLEMSANEVLDEADRLKNKLLRLYGVRKLALTGIELCDGRIATLSYDKDSSEPEQVHVVKKIKLGYPGTGDLFSSALLGKILDGVNFHESVDFACHIVADMIEDTSKYDTPKREGLRLEKNLYKLIK